MPKVKFLQDYTVKDKEGATYKAGKVYELETDASVQHFVSRRVAEPAPDSAKAEEPTYTGEPPTKRESDVSTTRKIEQPNMPGRQAPGAESPVAEDPAPKAIDDISRMTSEDKLQSIATADTRTTVQKAAQDRLAELKKK